MAVREDKERELLLDLAKNVKELGICGGELDRLVGQRGEHAMPVAEAAIIAKRIMLHLFRGSIDSATLCLEEGWQSRLEDTAVMGGKAAQNEPLSRVMDKSDTRLLNSLEQSGIMTVADLMKSTEEDWLEIPNVGESAVQKLHALRATLRIRSNV